MTPARAQELLARFRGALPNAENPVSKVNLPQNVVLENEAKKRVVVDFGQYVGTVVDENTGEDIAASTKGAISYGPKPHMYPTE